MADDRQSEVSIDVGSTADSQGPGNDLSEGRNDEFGMGNGSTRQFSINGSSRPSSHGSGTKDDFLLLWRLRKYLVLLGVLAVGVTYNAGLTPPGGFWTLNKDGHHAGDPILRDGYSKRYNAFFYCNATAFAASLVLIILLLSKSVTKKVIWLRSMQLTMIIDLFSLLGAYAAGSCRAVKSSIYIWILVFAVFLYIGIHILVPTKVIPEALTVKLLTALDRILTKLGVPDRQVISQRDVEEARKFILMLVTFAATITYQAGLNPPGGVWAENEHGSSIHLAVPSYKHHPATSVLRSNYLRRYNIFISFNSTSFVASLVIVILLLSPELSGHGIRTKAVIVCVVADLVCLIVAYAAGCCRDVATSFYVVFIIVIVLASFTILAATFVYGPVANLLKKVKSNCLWCMDVLGRELSLNNRSSNAEQGGPLASREDAATEANTPESQDHPADNQQVPDITEGENSEEHAPADNQQISDIEEAKSNSQHSSRNTQQSASVEDVVFNLECQSGDDPLCANMKEEDVSSSQHPSGNCQHSENTEDVLPNLEYGSTNCQQVADVEVTRSSREQEYPSPEPQDQPVDNQHVANMRQQSSTDDHNMSVLSVEQTMSLSHSSNGETSHHDKVEEGLSAPMEDSGNVGSAELGIPVEDNNHQTEMGDSNPHLAHFENGHTDSIQEEPTQNADDQTEKHLKKTRTSLLLLAILAVSLAYQSGLNPPGGFWSRSEDHHSAADRILEDNYHRRFITFFYLNAGAFMVSIIIIMMLLNKMMSKMVMKRRVLPGMMIVVLLSLTGAFATGSCREAKKQYFILVSVCIVLAYVILHVLIAIRVIPRDWRNHLWPVPSQPGHDNAGDDTREKELDRRRSLLLTLAILAVTVTYQAGMNPPGGVWSDDKDVTGRPGNPILQDTHRKRYDVFYYSNSVSFVSSVVVTILLVNKESCEHGIKSYVLRVCLVVGLLGLLIAYVAGSCRNIKQAIYLFVIAIAVLVSLFIQVLLSSALGEPLAQFISFLQSFLSRRDVEQNMTSSGSPEASDCEKIVRKRHKYLMLLAILAASIAYQAGMNPPGGLWSDDERHMAGNPILHDINHQRYKIFFCFNSFAFMASIVVIMLLLSKSVRKNDVPLEVLHLITILNLLALMTAFAAGSCRHLTTSVYVYGLVVGALVYVVLLVVLLRGIAKYLKQRQRIGLCSWGHLYHASRTNTAVVPEPGLQV
ncbi:uncharacterized protein LOC124676008 isoform X1 [Lolium rigidum]|uniref:uncharacterized protein LOC124676008 isoform X1 n=1 Tax=Lolium rigidum TaxID=89674 RepID=UPI001F5DD605|nr:uncharacterized protein LOC124676008 isoform X1 [Lolium rigidum]